MSDNDSCFISKLSHYIELSENDRSLLASLEESEESYSAKQGVHRTNDNLDSLFIVKSGWFQGCTHLPDGGRHIARIYFPGDLVGFPDLPYRSRSLDLESLTEGVLCPFPKSGLDDILVKSPRVTALLFTLALRESVVFIDRLRAISRTAARPRVAYLLLDLMARLQITNPRMGCRFRLPLTQSDIGDLVGLTNVSVSRTLAELEKEGFIERTGGDINVLNPDALTRSCDFVNRYAEIDTDWYPA